MEIGLITRRRVERLCASSDRGAPMRDAIRGILPFSRYLGLIVLCHQHYGSRAHAVASGAIFA